MAYHTSLTQDEDWFSEDETDGLASLWSACEPHVAILADHAREALTSVVPAHLADSSAWRDRQSAEVLAELRLAMNGEAGPIARTLSRYGARLARKCVPLKRVSTALESIKRRVVRLVVAHHHAEPAALEEAFLALDRLADRATYTITLEYLAYREQLMNEQRRSKDAALLRFTRLYEAGVLGIIVCDLAGNIREANDAFLTMVGYTREEVVSGGVLWSEITPPEWRALDLVAISQLQEHGRTGLWEKEYFRKDGSRVPILVGVAMLQGSECVAFVLDISERKRVEELRARSFALEAENDRIQEANRLKSEFLANMSHELRTPLNSIIGFADLLYDEEIPADSPEHREFLGDILKSGRHLLQLINDVLDLAKIEAGKMDFRPEEVDLRRVVTEVVDVLRSIANDNRISVSHEVHAEVHSVVVDPARLKQVLYNYLSNALKFTAPGGRVAVRALPVNGHRFRIEVEDTGIGIAESDISRLFMEFEQLDHGTTKRHPGTGLGLALTKRIVEAQHGSVSVTSVEGKGSVFSATLPRAVDHEAEQRVVVMPERYDDAPLVLVVDGDACDRQLIVRMLNGAGYGVEAVLSGQQAIAACRERAYDAITLDLMLPDLSGLEVLRRVRREGRNRDTPVIVVSVVAEQGVVHGFAVHDYLQKPLESAKLLDALQRLGMSTEREGPILVVDDDQTALKLMQTTLRKLGLRAEVCDSAASALESARSTHYCAVILDLLMPEMDGFEFLTHFRSFPAHRATPVVVWTVKDLTLEDRARLRDHVQAVFEKGSGRPQSLAEELRMHVRARSETMWEGSP